MWRRLRNLFRKKREDSFNKEGVIIKSAFVCGGVEYFEYDNVYNLSYQRGVAAIRVYEEVKMKCDYEFLKAHVTAMNNLFTESKKIGFEEISKMKKLNDHLKERLYNIVDTDIIYKLASVIFFDKNESPHEYDHDYARKKIAHWKKHATVTDFFLQEPLVRLIPYLAQPSVSLESYSEAIQSFNQIGWQSLWELLSESQRKTFLETKGFYVKEMQAESTN